LRICAAQVAEALALTPQDRCLLSLPISYVYGLSVVNSTLQAGGSLVLLRGTLADPAVYTKIAACAVTSIACVSQTFAFMREAGMDSGRLPTVRRLTHSGSPLPADLFSYAYESFGGAADIYLMYGQTEACGRISVLAPRELPHSSRSVGKALRGSTIAIDDDGQILYRGPGVMLGYACSRQDLALGDGCGGLLQTGDVGHLDCNGNLVITGRVSRYCKVFEQRLSLDEVEAFVNAAHPAAVVEKNGALVIVFEGTEPPASPSVLELSRRFRLPPQSFRTTAASSLPRTERGKIAYRTLLTLV
jgi:long-chain acyl-CoA synthetase